MSLKKIIGITLIMLIGVVYSNLLIAAPTKPSKKASAKNSKLIKKYQSKACANPFLNKNFPIHLRKYFAKKYPYPLDTTFRSHFVTTLGDFTIAYFSKTAPKHANNSKRLVEQGFYNGVRFHRIIKNFMSQTGDPYSKNLKLKRKFGMGDTKYTIPAEISTIRHEPFIVSAARLSDRVNPYRKSSGSQFFIMNKKAPSLNRKYTAFAAVIGGFDTVRKIAYTPVKRNRFGEKSQPIKYPQITKAYLFKCK